MTRSTCGVSMMECDTTRYDAENHVWEVGTLSSIGLFFVQRGSPKFKFRWEAEAYLNNQEVENEIV